MIVKRFQQQVERFAEQTAVKSGELSLTYNQLNRWANRIAHTVREQYPDPRRPLDQQTVGVLFRHGAGGVAAGMGALKDRKVYVPMDSAYPIERLRFMLDFFDISLLLTGDENRELAHQLCSDISPSTAVVNIDHLPAHVSPENPRWESPLPQEHPAYIIFTSGSQGKPKGVIQTLGNLLFFTDTYIDVLEITHEDRVSFLSSFSHDGAVEDIYTALLSGATLCPFDIKRQGVGEIAPWLTDEKISVYHSVPTVFRYLTGTLTGGETFPHLRVMCMGAERLREDDLRTAGTHFPNTRLVHMYGQTESSLNTIGTLDTQSPDTPVHIGRPLEDVSIYLLNEEGEEVNDLETGEIFVLSPYLSPGYWKAPEENEKAYIMDDSGRYYRTGDLARRDIDGTIRFMGRKDLQVKIRGYRIDPAEIESCLAEAQGVKSVVVTDREEEGETYLCAYFTAHAPISPADLRNHLEGRLPDFMHPAFFIPLDTFPQLPNGKIDRRALPNPEIQAEEEFTPPRDDIETALAGIWAGVLGLDKEAVGVHTDFFHSGGHSLKATAMTARVHRHFNVKLTLKEVFDAPTLGQLAQNIKNSARSAFVPLEPTEEKEYYLLSSHQKRLYILQQLDTAGTGYNMLQVFRLTEPPRPGAWETAFKALIRRHESLRTFFAMVEGGPVQRIDPAAADRFTVESSPESRTVRDFIRPFDLGRAPLLRAGITGAHTPHPYLVMDMHHIISDGVSLAILVRDFFALLNREPPPPLPIQYKDFAQWQQNPAGRERIQKQRDFWVNQFRDELPVMKLPADFPRPPVQDFRGAVVMFQLTPGESASLRQLALSRQTGMFALLLALFNVFLAKLSGSPDIIAGTTTAGREHAHLADIIGMFVNTLALRNTPMLEYPFTDFLQEVRTRTFQAFENQDYPFEDLVEQLNIRRDASRNPLFDTVLVLQNIGLQTGAVTGFGSVPRDLEHTRAKFDLTFQCFEAPDHLQIHIEYAAALFTQETVERFRDYFQRVVAAVAGAPQIRIADIDILSETEKQQLLVDFNRTGARYPSEKTIHQLFQEQVEKFPHRTALSYAGQCITYHNLNRDANRLAHCLRERGARPGAIIAVILERTPHILTALLAILKSGGAYLPILPETPAQRILTMLDDAHASLLVTHSRQSRQHAPILLNPTGPESAPPREMCYMDLELDEAAELPEEKPAAVNQPGDACYVIFTSGSTGKPKGVLVEHENVVRLMINDRCAFDFGPGDVWTLFHSYSFDFSVWEMYGALLYGGKLVVVPRLTAVDTPKFLQLLKREAVTVLNQTPSAFYLLAGQELDAPGNQLCLKAVIFGGEALKPAKLQEWRRKYPAVTLVNMFGITETTVHVTYKEIGDTEIDFGISNIGVPIPTLETYLMDPYLNLVPIGVAGELCVGGKGVARGYLNRVQLTHERFTHNPYKPGQRLYRSGDLARLLPDGEMEYLGRIDHQVQIRGFRIEPGEIENQLLRHPDIGEAVVIDRDDGKRESYLCAYYVSPRPIEVKELREHLAGGLPDYMIPAYFMPLDHIPLTPNGKIDRKALPAPEAPGGREVVPPKNELERIMTESWKEVLGLEQIGTHHNFFDLGGNSLDMVKITNLLKKQHNIEVPIVSLFRYPTVDSLVRYLEKGEFNSIVEREQEQKKGKNRMANLRSRRKKER